MLAVAFFTLIFSTILWLLYAVSFVNETLAGTSFAAAGMVNMLIYVVFITLPILIMWMVFGYINQYVHNRRAGQSFYLLFQQMKKNQDYADLIARALIESEQQIKDGFVLSKFDLLIADMNELLAEIIYDCSMASNEQIERLWNKVQNGGKWAFGKVIVEINQNQPNFQMRVYEKASQDMVLAGTIMEFCARYLSLISLLEKHDREKTFLNIVETGIFGKVFSIFAPVSDEIRRNRENKNSFHSKVQAPKAEEKTIRTEAPRAAATPQVLSTPPLSVTIPEEDEAFEEEKLRKPQISSIINKFGIFKKKEAPVYHEEPLTKDPFSIALERSFGDSEPEEPHFEIGIPESDEPVFESAKAPAAVAPQIEEKQLEPEVRLNPVEELIAAQEFEMADTQKAISDLKKDWQYDTSSASRVETPKQEPEPEENLAYPFGGWIDENKYNR